MTAVGGDVDALLGAVERVSTTEQVLRRLRAAIVAGQIEQGEQLREAQLAHALGTGRGAVREALRQLIQEGLVEHEVHRGTFVRTITGADVADVYRAREAVELAALERIRASPNLDLAPLRARLERMKAAAALGTGTMREMADVDIAFHEELVALARSPRLARMYATLAAESRMHLREYPPYPSLANVEDHERILVAIEARSRYAKSLLRDHLRYSSRLAVGWRDGGDA